MKKLFVLTIIISLLLISCGSDSQKAYQYVPNMMYSEAYEAYQEGAIFPNEQSALLPVDGTIPRGYAIYPYENSPSGYNAAKDELTAKIPNTEKNLVEGKALYDIYCAVCHGAKGDGQGVLVKNEVYLGVPNYKDRAITIGSVYHVMQYGINSMGSYAAQTDENERWQIAHYVMKLNAELRGEQAPDIVENPEDWQAQFAEGYEEEQAPITEE